MNSSQKETLDFSIVPDGESGYAIRLKGGGYDGVEYRYTLFQFEEKALGGNLYFDYEIVKNPKNTPRTPELHNFISFVTDRLMRSGLVKAVDEKNRNHST